MNTQEPSLGWPSVLPQGKAITVLSPEDGFMTTPSGIVEISAKTWEKAATTIALGIIFAAQHVNDPLPFH